MKLDWKPYNDNTPQPAPLDMNLRWDRIRARIKKRVSAEVYDHWFQNTRQLDSTNELTIVAVGSEVHGRRMQDEYLSLIDWVCLELEEPRRIEWRAQA